MKNSFTSFEIILSIFITSLIVVFTLGFSKQLYLTNTNTFDLEVLKIDLLATKVFLEKNSFNLKDKLKIDNNTLFYENEVLLKEVSDFSYKEDSKLISIELNLANKIKQSWLIKK